MGMSFPGEKGREMDREGERREVEGRGGSETRRRGGRRNCDHLGKNNTAVKKNE